MFHFKNFNFTLKFQLSKHTVQVNSKHHAIISMISKYSLLGGKYILVLITLTQIDTSVYKQPLLFSIHQFRRTMSTWDYEIISLTYLRHAV